MSNNMLRIDEATWFESEPSPYEAMLNVLRDIKWTTSFSARSLKETKRLEIKQRRTKEQENCQHGLLPFPINWKMGVHPTEEPKIFSVKLRSLRGGPYLMNAQQHQLLHDEGEPHEHF